jgi:transcriptional regulator with XRE-family HTH domain
MDDVPAELRAQRGRLKITQAEAADRLGVPKRRIERWESRGPVPTDTIASLRVIARFLGREPIEVLDAIDPPGAT